MGRRRFCIGNIEVIERCSMIGEPKKGKKASSALTLGALVPTTAVLEKFEAIFRW